MSVCFFSSIECFLIRGEVRADLSLELVNSGWKVTPQDGKTIYGHRGTAGFDPQKLCYVNDEQDHVSFCELPPCGKQLCISFLGWDTNLFTSIFLPIWTVLGLGWLE